MKIVKIKVCTSCLSPDIIDTECVCCFTNYATIELEFEECECCGQIKSSYLDNEFNTKQLEKLKEK